MRRPLVALVALLVLWFGGLAGPLAAAPARIKDLVDLDGVRGNDLLGYGLVVGLNNSGDSLRNSPFTEDAIVNILERLGVNVTGEQIRARNVAAVLVTAALPPFARAGSQIDVTVSAIGDARSLMGGTLVMTPLNAADGQIYAVAQGSIIAGGIVAEGIAASVTQGVPTAGLIPSGARVELPQTIANELPPHFLCSGAFAGHRASRHRGRARRHRGRSAGTQSGPAPALSHQRTRLRTKSSSTTSPRDRHRSRGLFPRPARPHRGPHRRNARRLSCPASRRWRGSREFR